MKKRKRDFDIFSLSFLDVISCGFGAIVLLVLISNNADAPSSDDAAIAQGLLRQVLQQERAVDALSDEVQETEEMLRARKILVAELMDAAAAAANDLGVSQRKADQLSDDLDGLAVVKSSLKKAAISPGTSDARDDEVGGIPVDSDYVIFIIDTSGSMKAIWDRVVAEVENVINIHPKIKGFQILNGSGAHLISAYAGKWIPDTPRRRKSAIDLFRTWTSASTSNPVDGLEIALKRYAKPNDSVSIYIFGDDYTGSSYDPVIKALVNLNTNRITGARLAKVHAVGFLSQHSTERFPILMREVTRQNGGSMIALPK